MTHSHTIKVHNINVTPVQDTFGMFKSVLRGSQAICWEWLVTICMVAPPHMAEVARSRAHGDKERPSQSKTHSSHSLTIRTVGCNVYSDIVCIDFCFSYTSAFSGDYLMHVVSSA